MDPTIDERLGGEFGRVPVALHGELAVDQDFAIRSNFHIDPREGGADGVDFYFPGQVGAHHRGGFGLTVAL